MSLTVGQLREHLANLPAHTPVFVRVRDGAADLVKPAAQPDRATTDVERQPFRDNPRVAAFVLGPVATPGYWYLADEEVR